MKRLREKNSALIGLVGLILIAVVIVGAFNFQSLPIVSSSKQKYSAYFEDAGGLVTGAPVQVSGLKAGLVSSIALRPEGVLVEFTVDKHIRLGERTEVAIRTIALLGNKILAVTPRGEGRLNQTIPLGRTISPYQLPDALGDLTVTISGLNTEQISTALRTLSETLRDTPPQLRAAVDGVARFSETLNTRDEQLRSLLANARKATTVLGERTDKIAQLISNTNAVLAQLNTQSAALDRISSHIAALSQQLRGFIEDHRESLRPTLDKLNGVLTLVDNHKKDLQTSLRLASGYALSFGEALSSGPFFKAYVSNLLPGQFIQPFVDAAFSDLGLDPNVLLPSERTDPEVGQPGTPALPAPFPRTGQGGEPRLTIPDAITGNPEDRSCGAPGVPLPGPGCYPYREPPPAPPPGGPPPGPPALMPAPFEDAGAGLIPQPVFQPAPNEAPPPTQQHGGGG